MENLKHIKAGLRAAESVWISPRKIWMILEIAAQLSANENVGIKEMLQLKEEADKLFDADGNLKSEMGNESDVVEPTEPRKTGFDFGAAREIADGQVCFIAITEGGMVFQPKRYTYLSGGVYDSMRDNGGIFKNHGDCQSYCDYLNSLTDGHS